MGHQGLRELEHLVLLAISGLESPVYGVPIIQELHRTVGRRISRASIYVVLKRLEARGLVASELGDPTPERGGRAKRYYALTPRAVRALKDARRDFTRLWAGSRVLRAWFIVVLLAGAGVRAQAAAVPQSSSTPAPLTLSGTWLNIDDPNATDVKIAASLPNALLTIAHAGERFDLTRSWSNAPIKEAHVCDGRQNTNGYSIVVERTTCRWDSATRTLVLEGTIGRADGTTTGKLRYRYMLDDQDRLVVERSRIVDSVSRPGSTTHRYRRVTDAGKASR